MIDFETDPFSHIPKSPSSSVCAVVLFFLVVLNSFVILRWTRLDTRPLAWDEAVHTRNSYEYRDRLADGRVGELFRPVYFNYPPLYNLTLIPFLDRAADVADAGACANVVYLAALILAVFFIGATLVDRWTGLAAAMVIGFMPIVVMMAHVTILDLALTTWVAWAFLALIRSNHFSEPGWSAAFGALLGLAMLTKWTAFVYLAGPAIPALVGALRYRTYRGVITALAAGLVVMAPWYVTNLVPMAARVLDLKDLPPAGGVVLHGLAAALWYPIALFDQLNIVFLVMFVVGLVVAIRGWREWSPVLIWLVISFLFFTLLNNKNTRYTLPALPAVALIAVAWVRNRGSAFAVAATASLAFFALFNFTSVATAATNVAGVRLTFFERLPPLAEDWKHRDIIDAVRQARDPAVPFSRVVTVSNAPYLHSTTLNISLQREGEKRIAFRGVSKRRWLDFAEFILVKTGDLGPAFTITTVKEYAQWLESPPSWFPLVYKEVGRWPLPDGSSAILYHAAPQARPVSENEMFSLSLTEVVLPNLAATNVEVEATPISPEETSRGRLERVAIRCSTVSFRGLEVTDVNIVLHRPHINLPRYRDENDVQLLSLLRLSLEGRIHSGTILAYARKKAKWLKEPAVLFEDDMVHVSGKAGPAKLEIDVRLEIEDNRLTPRLERLRVAGIPLPSMFFRALVERPVVLAPNRESPFQIDVKKIHGDGPTLRIGS